MKPDRKTIKRLYVTRELSLREIAEKLGVHHHTVKYYLEKYGIPARPKASRSALRKFKLEALEQGIREKGVRGYARELGIHENTLRYYLKKAKKAPDKSTNRVA